MSDSSTFIRISKLLSQSGICSRREADELIGKGWVLVDGVIATLGQKCLPSALISLTPEARKWLNKKVTILIHKPIGYVSGQAEDGYEPAVVLVRPENRDDRFPGPKFERAHLDGLAPAGRLDIDSKGLLVLTQDGAIAKQLIGEDSNIEKEYLVRVTPTPVTDEQIARLRFGISLDGTPLKRAEVVRLNEDQLKFILWEGKKRQIRRMCEAVGLKVTGLKRVRIGEIRLSALAEGKWRYLTEGESF